VEVASGFVRVGPLTAGAKGALVSANVSVLVVAGDAAVAGRLFGWYMLETKFCSGTLDLSNVPVSELKVDDEIVECAVADDGVVEQVVCFGCIGMQARLSTWKIEAFSRRAFGMASRLP
jgi:hypothetical protein